MGILSNFFRWIGSWFSKSTPPAPTPPVPQPPIPVPPPVPPQEEDPREAMKRRLLELHNEERSRRGINPLSYRGELEKAAQRHNDWMVRNNRLTHSESGNDFDTLRDHADRISREGYRWSWAGENIAMGQGGLYATPEAVFKGWMNSSGHRANILNSRFKDVGFGVTKDRNGGWWWTVNFGAERA
jgi:uncharacterized protein YkwD